MRDHPPCYKIQESLSSPWRELLTIWKPFRHHCPRPAVPTIDLLLGLQIGKNIVVTNVLIVVTVDTYVSYILIHIHHEEARNYTLHMHNKSVCTNFRETYFQVEVLNLLDSRN